MNNRSRGYTLISVLFASAIAGVVLVISLLIADQLSKSVSKSNAADNIESAVRIIQGLVANKEMCNNALRGASDTAKINFGGVNPAPVQAIYAQKTDGGGTIVLQLNQNIGPQYRVTGIQFQRRPNTPAGTIRLTNVAHTTYAGELVINFTGGEGMRSRVIPYNAVVDAANNIVRCYQDATIQAMCEQLRGVYDVATGACNNIQTTGTVDCRTECTSGGANCPGGDCAPGPPGPKCSNLYYVSGFNTGGTGLAVNPTPICRCQKVCVGMPSGPPSGSPSGGPFGGPGPGPGAVGAGN